MLFKYFIFFTPKCIPFFKHLTSNNVLKLIFYIYFRDTNL